MLDGLFTGLTTAVMPFNLMMVVMGCFAGTFIVFSNPKMSLKGA